jgi:hypothetical protein
LEDSSGVTILVVGTQSGNIYILINGSLMCTKVEIIFLNWSFVDVRSCGSGFIESIISSESGSDTDPGF